MIVPLSWLKEYVDIDITPQELETRLFDCGFEVETLTEVGAVCPSPRSPDIPGGDYLIILNNDCAVSPAKAGAPQ